MISNNLRSRWSRDHRGEKNPMFGKHHTKQTRKRLSDAGKGRIVSEETRKKISESNLGKLQGEKHPMFGKHHTESARKRMSESHPRTPKSEEMRERLSESNRGKHNHRGKNNPNYGKTGDNAPMWGKHHTEETKKKMSEASCGERNSMYGKAGEKSPRWLGGKSFEPYCPKFTKEFKKRVQAFFGNQCIECGPPQNGANLLIHHVDFNKNSCCDSTIPLFVPLCRSCHSKTNFNREYWKQHFAEIINNYYQGRCYLSHNEMLQLSEIGMEA